MKVYQILKKNSPAHLTLIDPGNTNLEQAKEIAFKACEAGTDAFLLGGSTNIDQTKLSLLARKLKETGKPVILFPGNINGLTKEAHAILYLVLMNSVDPYYITGVHVQAAPILLTYKLEVIPTSYVIVGYGGTVGHVGRAFPVPNEKPDLIASYTLAGAYMGSKAIYLEAGSGSPFTVNPQGVLLSKKVLNEAGLDVLLIVGGGIKSPEDAKLLIEAGADVLVTGTLAEKDPSMLVKVIEAIKK